MQMAKEIRDVIIRNRATLIGDALGVLSLAVILLGGLALPALF
jgi:hypothetical protein